jgi:DNA repair protein RadC
MTGTVVDTRIIFKTALEYNAISLILTHNHPSGKLVASESDKEITRKLQLAGKQMDIMILDHVIITESSYFSFADEGIF